MKAIVYKGKHDIALEELSIPLPRNGEVLIKVAYAGICGSDVSIYAGLHPRAKPGLVMGHEFSGTVEQIAEGAGAHLQIGDRVVAEPLISCGSCSTCLAGHAYVCENLGLYGIDAPGAFTEYLALPASKVFKLPKAISMKQGALMEPLAVAVHSIRTSKMKSGDFVCVLGAGPVGLLTALAAREFGAGDVVVAEVQDYRMKLARDLGFTTVGERGSDIREQVLELTEGRGADVVFEAAGSSESMLAAPGLCRVKGELVIIAMPKKPREMDIVAITFKELRLKGVRVYAPGDFASSLELQSKANLNLEALLSEPFPLEQAEKAFETARAGNRVMRVLFRM